MTRYWLNLFSLDSWDEFIAAGGEVTGFRASRWNTVRKIKPGDRMLAYVTGISRIVGVFEVTGAAYKDDSGSIWEQDFPCRLPVKEVAYLTPETAIPIKSLRDELTIFQDLSHPTAWTGHVRGSPTKWKTKDGEAIEAAVHNAKANPVERPIRRPKKRVAAEVVETDEGTVTLPQDDPDDEAPASSGSAGRSPTEHDEVQWLLLKLGDDMGLRVWVARNDRGRTNGGQRFDSFRHSAADLPRQFDDATMRIIELIDVIWLQENAIVAAFEIESTTSVYSGLLRMGDLISMQPNLKIPLYIVAPDERKDKVIAEVNRPTFARLRPPMREVCEFIPFSVLRERMAHVGDMARYLRPEFLSELSETCEIEEP